MNKLKYEFDAIKWPIEFIVEFNDGREQILASAKGVQWDDGNDLWGKNENRANINCCWKKKSPSQQKYRRIQFFIDEIKCFKSLTGEVIWKPIS